jgi:hypothetical protein
MINFLITIIFTPLLVVGALVSVLLIVWAIIDIFLAMPLLAIKNGIE